MNKEELTKYKLKWKLTVNLPYPKCFSCSYCVDIQNTNFLFSIGCKFDSAKCLDGTVWFQDVKYYDIMHVYNHVDDIC